MLTIIHSVIGYSELNTRHGHKNHLVMTILECIHCLTGLVCNWKLLQSSQRAWHCYQVLSTCCASRFKLYICLHFTGTWVCVNRGTGSCNVLLQNGYQSWSKTLQCMVSGHDCFCYWWFSTLLQGFFSGHNVKFASIPS
jgi:hypothetical protein